MDPISTSAGSTSSSTTAGVSSPTSRCATWSTRRAGSEASGHAASLPAAAAKLAAVDDAVVLIASGAEHGRAAHRSVTDFAVKEVADRAAFIAGGERKLDQIAAQLSADRPLELGRALMAGELGAALLDIEPVDARTLQKVDTQFPVAGDFDRRRAILRRRGLAGLAQHRR